MDEGKADNCKPVDKYNKKSLTNEENQYCFNSATDDEKERHSSGESCDSTSQLTPAKSDPKFDSGNEEASDECDDGIEIEGVKTCIAKPIVHTSALKIEVDLKAANQIEETDAAAESKAEVKRGKESSCAAESTKDNLQPRGILKRCVRRCFSESHATSQENADDISWSNFDCSDTIPESLSSASSEDSRAADDGATHKKSVRFNEVVQRQIFRSNSSILGQKYKNMKKNEQKMRKRARGNMATERRASKGDAASLLDAGFKLSSSFENSTFGSDGNTGYSSSENGSVSPVKNNAFDKFPSFSYDSMRMSKASIQYREDNESMTDSGVASSYEEHQHISPVIMNKDKIEEGNQNEDTNKTNNETSKLLNKKSKKNKKNKLSRGKPQQQGHFIKETNSDLIFDLDF